MMMNEWKRKTIDTSSSIGGICMKRILSVFIVFLLVFSVTGALTEDNISPEVYSYQFSLRFHLNTDGFQPLVRSHLKGYSDLLDMLSLNGSLTWSPDTESIDLQLDIIPETNPSAALSMHFYGIPEHICMNSSLIGDETIWFNNFVLMEFALKTWNNLNIPLQYLALLFPYVTQNAFQRMFSDWTETVGPVTESRIIQSDTLAEVSARWTETLQEDQRLLYWISALSVLSEDHMILENEISGLPGYLLENISGNRDLTAVVGNGKTEWVNQTGQILFGSSEDEGGDSWYFSLPPTNNGYIPGLSYSCTSDGASSSVHMSGSYHLSAENTVRGDNSYSVPVSLLDFNLDICTLPETWPVDSSFSAVLETLGTVLPNMSIRLMAETKENGEISISVFDDESILPGSDSILTCTGTILPVEPHSVPAFSVEELTSHLNIFSVNDKTVSEFSRQIRRPLISGILNFLDVIPASSCQSIMDDLEEYGLLNLLLGEE